MSPQESVGRTVGPLGREVGRADSWLVGRMMGELVSVGRAVGLWHHPATVSTNTLNTSLDQPFRQLIESQLAEVGRCSAKCLPISTNSLANTGPVLTNFGPTVVQLGQDWYAPKFGQI